jgi:hypothetical protein
MGFGPNIYLMTYEGWIGFLGEDRGAGLCAMLLTVGDYNGACPKHVALDYGGGRHSFGNEKQTANE